VKKLGIATITLTITAAVVFAQQPAKMPAQPDIKASQPVTSDPVIISYGTTQIHQSEFEAAVKTLPPEYQAFAQGSGKKAFAEDYVRMKMLASEAEKNGLEKNPDVAAQLLLMRANALANAEMTRMELAIAVPDDEIQSAYDAKKPTLEQARARHILIAFKGSPAARPGAKELTEEEAKAKAEEIRQKLVAGADFAETAKKESDDVASGEHGGELGTFSKGRMVPEFEKAAFEGKVGEISPIIRTQFGFHILQVEERKTQSLDELKPQLLQDIRQKKMQEMLENMKNSAKATFSETYFAAPAPESAPAVSEAPKAQKKPAETPKPKKADAPATPKKH
jgi:peptidyl-prolyl cis-trans isomerase C